MNTADIRKLKVGILALAGAILVVTFVSSSIDRDDHRHHQHSANHSLHGGTAHVVDGEMVVHARHGAEISDFRWDHLVPPERPTTLVDLENELDPVSLKPVGHVVFSYKGFVIRFENERTRERFRRKPIKYLNQLSLEPQVNGTVIRVDASAYQDAVTELCPFMPESEVDPHGTVYLLHRGWKFYFCCWTGCGDEFIRNPAGWYDYYGLEDRGGTLVQAKETVKDASRPKPLDSAKTALDPGHDTVLHASESAEGAITVTIRVPDMVCQRCSDIVDSELKRRTGVLHSRTDASNKIARIVYQPSQIKLKEIISAIEDAGYSTSEVKTDAD